MEASSKKETAYSLNDNVKLRRSKEEGQVIGIAQYSRGRPSFLVEYVTADGRQTDGWFDEDALSVA